MTNPAANPPPLLRFFGFEHLPPSLQAVSRPFSDLAHALAQTLPQGPETTTALRKLLESKDCAVRAALDGAEAPGLKPRPIKDNPQA